ncbi:hypothetical protein DFH08DRAFT_958952 [Mycena albidolilacea]|uniref:CNNM transmembrane domain-containing protein n=1 Tax=Mycena albidolilacea TaxID=1033008 RepID=A0AAD7ET56_9AGAR|nr:hypothetical protein DFH08DRAFT_958952 [Mycena albidolilacea]
MPRAKDSTYAKLLWLGSSWHFSAHNPPPRIVLSGGVFVGMDNSANTTKFNATTRTSGICRSQVCVDEPPVWQFNAPLTQPAQKRTAFNGQVKDVLGLKSAFIFRPRRSVHIWDKYYFSFFASPSTITPSTPYNAAAILRSPTGLKTVGIRNVTYSHTHPEMVISMGLVLLGGVFAGLTLGLMGLDELHLRVLAASSVDKHEQRNAKKVLALMQKGRHWVLVVLLLSNVIINESLPIFLDSAIGGGFAAVALSTAAIVVFGIIPQAVSVRYGLSIGAACTPFVLALMYLFAPIAYPIARILDAALGTHETHTYKKAELKSFLQFHRTGEEPLHDDEISILNGVLELNTKHDVVTLSASDILDHALVDTLILSGYSRFPVHEPHDPDSFLGLLLIKKLINYDTGLALPVSALPLSILPEAPPSINCFQALDYFQTGRAHLLLISRMPGKPGGAIGVITLEDIIEEILSEEIVDETDRYQDNISKALAKRLTTTDVMQGIVERQRCGSPYSYEYTPLSCASPPSNTERTPLVGGGGPTSGDITASLDDSRMHPHPGCLYRTDLAWMIDRPARMRRTSTILLPAIGSHSSGLSASRQYPVYEGRGAARAHAAPMAHVSTQFHDVDWNVGGEKLYDSIAARGLLSDPNYDAEADHALVS